MGLFVDVIVRACVRVSVFVCAPFGDAQRRMEAEKGELAAGWLPRLKPLVVVLLLLLLLLFLFLFLFLFSFSLTYKY